MSLPGTGRWPNVVMPPAEVAFKGIGLKEEPLSADPEYFRFVVSPVACQLLLEIQASGYIKTKHTGNETRLEERVDEFLKGKP